MEQTKIKKPLSRQQKLRALSAAVTVLILAAAVLLNCAVTLAGRHTNMKLDLTANQAFVLSEDSLTFLDTLEEPVTITILADPQSFSGAGAYFRQAAAVLEQYDRASDLVTTRYTDLVKEPTFAASYPDLQLSVNDILVETGGQIKKLSVMDLFNIQQSFFGWSITSSRAEETMTSALMAMTSDEDLRAVLLTGHGESGYEGLASLLEQNNFTVETQSLVTGDLDSAARLVVLSAPVRDFEEPMLDKLQSYLELGEGHSILYLADSAQPELPELEQWLESWGIGVETGAVFETDSTRIFSYNPYFPVVEYTEPKYARELKDRGLLSVMPYSRPLHETEPEHRGTVDTLLAFSSTGGVVPAEISPDWEPGDDDLRPDIPALMLSTHPQGGRLLVSGSLAAVDRSILTSTTVNNAQFFMNVLNDLTGRQAVISILPKELGGGELTLTSARITLYGAVFIVLLPLAVLAMGVIVWLRRRRA